MLLVAIFVAGFFTGRWSVPIESEAAPVFTTNEPPRPTELALRMLSRQVSLDPQQQERIRDVIEDISTEMEVHPHGSRERMEIFQRSVPRMREVLRPDQYAAFDAYVQATTRRFERKISRDNFR